MQQYRNIHDGMQYKNSTIINVGRDYTYMLLLLHTIMYISHCMKLVSWHCLSLYVLLVSLLLVLQIMS